MSDGLRLASLTVLELALDKALDGARKCGSNEDRANFHLTSRCIAEQISKLSN